MNFKLKLDETVRENQELHKNLAGILSKTINQTVHKKSSFSPSASSLKRSQHQRWIQRRFPPNIKFDSPNEEWSRLLPPEFLSSTDHTPEGMQIAIKHLKLNWLWTKFGDDIGYHQAWSPQDRNLALKAVTVFVQKKLTSNVLTSKDNKNIQDLTNKLDSLQKLSNRDILARVDSDPIPIDWFYVSRMVGARHSPQSCEQLWVNVLSPKIKSSQWTQAEKTKLIDLMSINNKKTKKRPKKEAQHFERNPNLLTWEDIAAEFPGRTPQECVTMWIRHLMPEVDSQNLTTEDKERRWNKKEDEMLNNAVLLCGENWEAVSMIIPGRNKQQCAIRYLKSLVPQIKKGRWSGEEDSSLKAAAQTFGIGSWTKIAAQVPGRSDVQCRERWVNVLDPSTVRSAFTAEEDQKILDGVARFGKGKWSSIALLLPGRTDNMVSRRYKFLSKSKKKRK
jgi:hypothetical protein